MLDVIQSPQPPPYETLLITLLNDIATTANEFILVLDDYHLVDAEPVDRALAFLLKNLPSQMHVVITTREDPSLPLARYRARGQSIEMRARDLRFTFEEAAQFLNRVMSLDLSVEAIEALEKRTEGWIAGLQLAALSMVGHQDTDSFITSFTGTHHYVLDYLVEEVLEQQPERIQSFLLKTAILGRLTGPLCDALTGQTDGQQTLEYLERANLFLIPLDNERRWYRYHHLFADLLCQRLHQRAATTPEGEGHNVAQYHRRASQWFEMNGLEVEAFQHAAAAHDIQRAERLMAGEGMPLYFRGAMGPVLNWLQSLPTDVLVDNPSLWVSYASALTIIGQQIDDVEEHLQAAEAALQNTDPDTMTRDLLGQIAATRAMLAIPREQVDTIITQSNRALEYLHPDNLPLRTTAMWTLGYAHQLQGNRSAAKQIYTEIIPMSEASGNTMITIGALVSLGQVQEADNELHLAAETYRRILPLAGDPPLPGASEAHFGLARIHYEWSDLEAAQQHAEASLPLAQQMENVDSPGNIWMFLSRLRLAQGDVFGAIASLVEADQFVTQRNFVHRLSDVAAARVAVLLHQGDVDAAADLAETRDLPISRAGSIWHRAAPPQPCQLWNHCVSRWMTGIPMKCSG